MTEPRKTPHTFRAFLDRRWPLLLLAAFFCVLSSPGAPTATEPSTPEVNTDCVLAIGEAKISTYAVEKNLQRYRSGYQSQAAATDDELRKWFELYLARQVIIAEALAQNYDKRAEVIEIVDTMERHMLAQVETEVQPPSEAELRAVYDKLPPPPAGPQLSFATLRPRLERLGLQQKRLESLRLQKDTALRATKPSLTATLVAQVAGQISHAALPKAEIPQSLLASCSTEILARYELGGKKVELTVEEWRAAFNRLFVRSLPRSTTELEENIREQIVAAYACDEAKKAGRNQEPRFVEDRRNFVYYQALDLYEKERLAPQLTVSAQELGAFYKENPELFRQALRASGLLFRFPDAKTAAQWLREQAHAPKNAPGEKIVISKQSPLPGAENATPVILRLPDGKFFGPVEIHGSALVILKQSTETGLPPLTELEGPIRATLTRQKLDELELRLAREWSPRFAVEDHVAPERFGIKGPVAKPWIR